MPKYILIFLYSLLLIIPKNIFANNTNTITPTSKEESPFLTEIQTHSTLKYLIFSEITTIGFMFIGMEVLYKMPQNFTNWSPGEKKYDTKKWVENNKKGPVMDKDPFIVNFVQHPYWGGVYYMQGRKAGLNQFNSFLLAALNSTIWEFGIEAFEERPSIQDIIYTPILGALVGEGFFQLTKYISGNNNKLFGSKFLGNFTMLAMDPMGYIIERTPIHKLVTSNNIKPQTQTAFYFTKNEVSIHITLTF